MNKSAIICMLMLAGAHASAGVMDDFDSLGGNGALLERAKALNPEKNIEIVENRTVSREKRFEVAPEFATVMGGDTYLKTQVAGMNINYHWNSRWGVSFKYNTMFNKLSDEALNLIHDSSIISDGIVPEINYPKSQMLGLVTFAPIYGKLNLFNKGVAQFDVYALAGSGDIELSRGRTSTWTAGGGIGFWLSQHLTTRFEMRYQNYTAKNSAGEVPMDLTVASLQMGYLL